VRLIRSGLAVGIVLTFSACSGLPQIEDHPVGDAGHIEVRKSEQRGNGIVIGATQGWSEPAAAELATALSDETGAGLVIAYGFRSKRIPVGQPLVHMSPILARPTHGRRPGSVYPEFRRLVRNAVDGPLEFYIGVRHAAPKSDPNRIEVATAGLTFEQLAAVETAFLRIRDRTAENSALAKIEIALNPLTEISWNVLGAKNHGVLLLAKKGMILRLPEGIAAAPFQMIYRKLMTEWVGEALTLVLANPASLPEMRVQLMQYGRMESIPSRESIAGVVIGAPHGSFDPHTAEFAQHLGYRTGFAVVAAKGFSPTEAGGWRINVNRPTEKLYPRSEPEQERATDRAREIYQRFRDTVFEAAAGPLELYIDLHQNAHDDNIDVATLGVSPSEAAWIKGLYVEIRTRWLRDRTDMPLINMAIEPIDKVTFRARVAKEQGILKRAKRSLHFELPGHRAFANARVRHAYTEILGETLRRLTTKLRAPLATPAASLAPIRPR
jgi:hypothetical protein